MKTTTTFSPFSLFCRTKVVAPVELAIPTPRVVLEEVLGDLNDAHAKERMVNLEGLEERRELAKRQSQMYQQKMAKAYEQAVHSRIFTQGQLVLKGRITRKEKHPRTFNVYPKVGRSLCC